MTEETVQTEEHQPSEAEVKAQRLGWVPKDQFRGDPEKWRPAEEFLERGESLMPLLQRDIKRLHRQIDQDRKTFAEFMEKAEKDRFAAEERAYKRGKAEAEAKLDAAIQNADVAGAQQAKRELAALEEAKPQAPQKIEEKKPQVDPDIQEWMDENPWFNKDQALTAYAGKVFGQLENAGGMSRKQMLAETKKRVMERFPEDFGINPRREQAASVAAPNGGTAPAKKNARSYENLPPDAKKACDKFCKTIPGYTKDKYVAAYDWD
jgi:hypothetical protein